MTHRVALFRARDDIGASAARLRRLGFAVASLPATRVRALPFAPPARRDAAPYDAVLATSAKAIVHLPAEARGRLGERPLFVVGAQTARAASRAGWPLAAPAAPDAAGLAELLTSTLARGARLLYLAGRDRKDALEAALGPRFELEIVEVYSAEAVEAWSAASARRLASCVAGLHYSRRSAALAGKLAAGAGRGAHFRAMIHVCLSADVAAGLAESGATRIVCAASADEAALIDALSRALGRDD